jgi:hypothetical protein
VFVNASDTQTKGNTFQFFFCFFLSSSLFVQEYIRRNSGAVIRALYPALAAVVRDHWNEGLQRAAFDLQQWLKGKQKVACHLFK